MPCTLYKILSFSRIGKEKIFHTNAIHVVPTYKGEGIEDVDDDIKAKYTHPMYKIMLMMMMWFPPAKKKA